MENYFEAISTSIVAVLVIILLVILVVIVADVDKPQAANNEPVEWESLISNAVRYEPKLLYAEVTRNNRKYDCFAAVNGAQGYGSVSCHPVKK